MYSKQRRIFERKSRQLFSMVGVAASQSFCVKVTAALALLLLIFASTSQMFCQSSSGQPPQGNQGHKQPGPVPLPHLYWHFLLYQYHLDAKAAEMEAQGKDGKSLRNHLQAELGFADADYAPLRDSSQRLASELKSLDEQAKSIMANGRSASAVEQMKALKAQREAYIQAEILVIKQQISADRIAVLETFLTQFFSPKNLTAPTSSSSGQQVPVAHP